MGILGLTSCPFKPKNYANVVYSGVYALALHPTIDVLCTGGRDGVVRVWDMRTRTNVHVLGGHKGTISSILTQEADPQVISGSMDSHVRLWDLAAGKT